jgi:hypothetical protein
MAIVKGIREKVHLPLYDSIFVEPKKQLRDVERTGTLKLFVNVQNKSRLETNLQSASLLPHYNTFEARAMRVVISDLPPEFPNGDDDQKASGGDQEEFKGFDITEDTEDANVLGLDDPSAASPSVTTTPNPNGSNDINANLEIDLERLMELLKEARDGEGEVNLNTDDDEVAAVVDQNGREITDGGYTALENNANGAVVTLTVSDLESMIQSLKEKSPPLEQIRPNDGAGNLISKLIYNTVTTFYVGEKIMIEMPTFFFPAGSGTYSLNGKSVNHGEPNPLATFRFAEPIFIDRQQNFRVEIEIPDADTVKEMHKIYGPLNIWVIIDGYMTRGVQ